MGGNETINCNFTSINPFLFLGQHFNREHAKVEIGSYSNPFTTFYRSLANIMAIFDCRCMVDGK